MTLQNLSKILDRYQEQLGITETKQLELLKGLPFYSGWISFKKADLDFNHAIGLPQKNGHSYPVFGYEELVFEALQKYKHIWIKKATGLGITEFLLRFMCWLCLRDDKLRGSQMCIVTGPRLELAVTLIDRMKSLFGNIDFEKSIFDTKETVIELNGVHIEAYPSHHLDL
jgi:hypothetical protein